MKESVVERYLKEQCKKHDFLCYKFISPSQSGVPDRVIIGHGYTIFIEMKAPDKTPRKLQERVIKRMIDHGANVFVIDTKEKVDSFFDQIETKPINNIKL